MAWPRCTRSAERVTQGILFGKRRGSFLALFMIGQDSSPYAGSKHATQIPSTAEVAAAECQTSLLPRRRCRPPTCCNNLVLWLMSNSQVEGRPDSTQQPWSGRDRAFRRRPRRKTYARLRFADVETPSPRPPFAFLRPPKRKKDVGSS